MPKRFWGYDRIYTIFITRGQLRAPSISVIQKLLKLGIPPYSTCTFNKVANLMLNKTK